MAQGTESLGCHFALSRNRPQQHYIDDHGTRITVINVEEKRVVFMRDGYPYPCMRPMYNFLTRFQKVSTRQGEAQSGE
ncbi:TPA: DUF4222 domain-containing protein [Salmonella enterica]|uniref:DUF4222 domain-containing protein n=1 Tax=Salmonella enterica TaxID=28901 RepID=A0A763QRA0_SALER|nr:DUF4222 domain-containing protein [Salmonella enterica]HAG4424255.1 DUF4222 domain-containing protein [Salmonella enterica]